MTRQTLQTLEEHGIQPSPHRVAVADYVLHTTEHPSADRVLTHVRAGFPMISRATVYNTLNLFVKKGLLQPLVLAEGKVVFDPNTDPHHHFVDDASGRIYDVPWKSVAVRKIATLDDFDIREYQVVMRGKIRRGKSGRS